MWKIPENVKKLLRKYSFVFTSGEHSHNERVLLYYNLLSPQLDWLKEAFIENNISEDLAEAESEIYILIDSLLTKFNPEKGSIVPYLGTVLPWKVYGYLEDKNPVPPSDPEPHCDMPNEVYLHTPDILFQDRWLLRDLPRSHKYLIVRILASEEDVTYRELANSGGLGRTKLYERISELSEILAERGLKPCRD